MRFQEMTRAQFDAAVQRPDEALATDRTRLRGLVDGEDWQEVVVPALEAKLRMLERSLAAGRGDGIETVRFLQGQHAILNQILADPLNLIQWRR